MPFPLHTLYVSNTKLCVPKYSPHALKVVFFTDCPSLWKMVTFSYLVNSFKAQVLPLRNLWSSSYQRQRLLMTSCLLHTLCSIILRSWLLFAFLSSPLAWAILGQGQSFILLCILTRSKVWHIVDIQGFATGGNWEISRKYKSGCVEEMELNSE
jgi:hypothetical protein